MQLLAADSCVPAAVAGAVVERDDEKGTYYAWTLPAPWRSLMACLWPVPGYEVGCPDKEPVCLASAVIPMGWLNAASLFQHLHRQLGGMSPEPSGARLLERCLDIVLL